MAAPLLLLVVVLVSDAWVWVDARGRERRGQPVIVSVGGFQVTTAAAWVAWTALLWVFFLPLYLTARRSS